MNIRQCSQKANALRIPGGTGLQDGDADDNSGIQWPHDAANNSGQQQGPAGIQMQHLGPQEPQQDPALVNVGMVVWQSGFVLAELLLRRPPLGSWPGVRVLELGAGTGITGIALALAGARVMLTDLPHILPLTRENVTANLRPIHAAMVAEHRWGSDATPLLQLCGGYPDIIAAADCIYETQFHGALLSTLQQCMGSHSQAFFSYRNRTAKEQTFAATAAAHGFAVETVPTEQLAEDYQTGGYCVLRLARIDGVPEQTNVLSASQSPWLAHSSIQHCSGRQEAGETRLDLGVPACWNGDYEEEEEGPEHKPCSQS